MKKKYTWKNPSREYFVKTFSGKADRNAKIMELRKQSLSFQKIADKLVELGYERISRWRVAEIYHSEVSPLT